MVPSTSNPKVRAGQQSHKRTDTSICNVEVGVADEGGALRVQAADGVLDALPVNGHVTPLSAVQALVRHRAAQVENQVARAVDRLTAGGAAEALKSE